MKQELIIRTDVSTHIGTGHMMRCIALAQAWQKKRGGVTFLSHCQSDVLRQRIIDEGFGFTPIEKPHPEASDLNIVLERLSAISHQPSANPWLVLDGYHFGPDYQRSIREAGGRLLVIDDYNHLPSYHADILLNQNIGAEMIPYVCDPDTVGLFGPKYALLRTEFLALDRKVEEQCERPRSILVTLGGGDPDNITLKVVRALLQMGFAGLEVKVVAGPANPNVKVLEREIESAQKAGMPVGQAMQVVRDAYMPELMARADVAISAGGSTCWELCFLGVPILVIISAENQHDIALGLDSAGAAASLGWHEDIDVPHLATEVENLLRNSHKRKSMSLQARRIVDGRGRERILTLMGWLETAAEKEDILLRKVSLEDTIQLWRLANNREVRRNSFSPEYIPYDQHLTWFNEKLESSTSVMYVLDVAGVIVAQIRYDRKDDAAEIDYAVIPGFRGKSLGRKMLQMTWKTACQELEVSRVRGVVKEDNEVSIYSFLKAGFEMVRRNNYSGFDCVVFEKKLN